MDDEGTDPCSLDLASLRGSQYVEPCLSNSVAEMATSAEFPPLPPKVLGPSCDGAPSQGPQVHGAGVQSTSTASSSPAASRQISQPRLFIPDGGGNGSSAAWLCPLVAKDHFRDLRRALGSFVLRWGLVGRLRSWLDKGCAECLFSPDELMTLRNCLVEFARDKGFRCSTTVAEFQPLLLEV